MKRTNMSFRPQISDTLESRLVLSGVSALTAYKAGLAPAIQNILGSSGSMQNALNTALSPYTSFPSFTVKSAGPAAYAMLQAGVQQQIANASDQLTNLLSPLNKSKNIVATVQNELVGTQPGSLATQLNTMLNQLATTANVSNDPNGLVPLVDSHAASLAYYAAGHMMDSVYQAVENQVDLFLYAKGIANRPGKAFQAARLGLYNSQLDAAFSTFTTKVQAAFAAYPSLPSAQDTVTFSNAIYTQLGALNVATNNVFTANSASGAHRSALQSQVSGLNSGSIYQVTTSFAFDNFNTFTTYPAGFVNSMIADMNTLMHYDLAATGSAK